MDALMTGEIYLLIFAQFTTIGMSAVAGKRMVY